jgi:CARDB
VNTIRYVSNCVLMLIPLLFSNPVIANDRQYQYAVKFVCGKSEGKATIKSQYLTAINVHNPSTSQTVPYWFKVAIAESDLKQGTISTFALKRLGPDGAAEAICADIYRQAGINNNSLFYSGFAVFESNTELDIVAVYTSTTGNGGSTIDVERFPARYQIMGSFADLVVESVCRLQSNPVKIRVRVKNIGTNSAAASSTRVTFIPWYNGPVGTPQLIEATTPALVAGASVDIEIPIPQTCFQPDCKIRALADSLEVIFELNETNNLAEEQTCIG